VLAWWRRGLHQRSLTSLGLMIYSVTNLWTLDFIKVETGLKIVKWRSRQPHVQLFRYWNGTIFFYRLVLFCTKWNGERSNAWSLTSLLKFNLPLHRQYIFYLFQSNLICPSIGNIFSQRVFFPATLFINLTIHSEQRGANKLFIQKLLATYTEQKNYSYLLLIGAKNLFISTSQVI
jgi:hypothetical protein